MVQTFSLVSTCPTPAFSSRMTPSACTPLSSTSTTLSPKAAAISSSVLCLVSLEQSQSLSEAVIRLHCCRHLDSRKVEVRDDQKEERAAYEHVVVVLSNVSRRTLCHPSWHAWIHTSSMFANADGPASVMPTLTMKWEAAARPITLDRRAIGKTSAPSTRHDLSALACMIVRMRIKILTKPGCRVQHAV